MATRLATPLGAAEVTQRVKRVRFYATIELVNTLAQEKAAGKASRLAGWGTSRSPVPGDLG